MNKVLIALAALSTLAAVPASAQSFSGPRVEASVGFDDVTKARDTSNVLYGINAGIDAPINSSNFRIGADLTTTQLFDSRKRDIGVNGRLGYVFNDRVMPYVQAGYVNVKTINFNNRERALDGFRLGGGVEYAFTRHFYTGAEYTYTDLAGPAGKNGGMLKFGFRL